MTSYLIAAACFAAGVLAGWLIDRALAWRERKRATPSEVRTFIEIGCDAKAAGRTLWMDRDVIFTGSPDKLIEDDFHFESSLELWTARRK